jgi:hypothetical protein
LYSAVISWLIGLEDTEMSFILIEFDQNRMEVCRQSILPFNSVDWVNDVFNSIDPDSKGYGATLYAKRPDGMIAAMETRYS